MRICQCIFIKKSKTGFAIIDVYDLNLIGTLEEFKRTTKYSEIFFLPRLID